MGAMIPKFKQITLTIASGAALTEAFDFRQFLGGVIFTPGGWTAANIGFQAASEFDGTYRIVRDTAGDEVEIGGVAVDSAMEIPSGLRGAAYVKLWSKATAAETDVNQAADRTLVVQLKSAE